MNNLRSRAQFALPVLALLFLSACGGGSGGGGSSTPEPIATLSPGSLTFPLQALSTPSASQQVTLKNTGSATLTLPASPITVTGTDAADFSFSSNCTASLAVNATCSISVTFTPSAAGSRSATLNVASNAAGSPATLAMSGSGTGDNALPVTVDLGPLANSNPTANILYADVKFCTPGTNFAQCATVSHIQVDTGSYGLRVFKSTLDAASGSAVVPTIAAGVGVTDHLFECVQYADGFTWGSVAIVDVQVGQRRLTNLRIQLTGDPNFFGTVPYDCSHDAGGTALTDENQVSSFGANGILGIGQFAQDCGAYCADPTKSQYANYYNCPAASACGATTATLTEQVTNPVYLMTTDNNGVLVNMPAVSAPGAATVSGIVFFGVNTQSDNSLGSEKWFQLDPNAGTLSTTYLTSVLGSSIVDSGSNAYYFDNPNITKCSSTNDPGWFYCPSSTSSQTAVINGYGNSAAATINFKVDNTDTLFSTYGSYAAYPNLGGPIANIPSLPQAFDWGLPFFYGRPVFVLIEGRSVTGSAVIGPALAF